jgi:thiamine pyrophosphokinase
LERVVIFANGHLPDPEAARALLQEGDFLVAADGGAQHLFSIGIQPDVLIGDLDSVSEELLADLVAAEVEVAQFPEDKDETDLELALAYALERRPTSILIVAALGGRLDQTVSNLMLLTNPGLAGLPVSIDDGIERAFFCRKTAEIEGRKGDVVSLMPWGAPVEGLTTQGLQWPLVGETLYTDRSRGISNLMLAERASLTLLAGLLLVIHRRVI